MTQNKKQLTRLTGLLKDLFQLDQPELDFGLYKIMHAKSVQITHFLENDLLKEIESAFGARDGANAEQIITQARAELFKTLGDTALDVNGKLNPAFAGLPAGKKYLDDMAAAEQAKDALSTDAEIFDHLYRFFERYYDSGDFLSKRYYARENDTRAAPYSVPYDGREVYLHWANKDQYYIKSGENFSHYTFDLIEAVKKLMQSNGAAAVDGLGLEVPDIKVGDKPLKVHLRIAEAQEGEHGNIKAAENQMREFIPLMERPAEINASGELELNFEYKVLSSGYPSNNPEIETALKAKFGNINKGDMPAHWMADVFLQAIAALDSADKDASATANTADYARLLGVLAPTDKQAKRPLLAKYISLYTARNTMDYFIHKDLGGFLRRELDFYIKNEVMRLDDIESAEAPKVEQVLGKIKVLRRVAHQLIAFLAQLEDFQKKLWLKKKFVTETNYCITLDRVPEHLYPAIAANDAQRKEWVKLFAIDEIKGDMATVAYSAPLTVEFLKANPFLLIDTALFDDVFKAELLASINNFDAQCDGVLIHSENFQALKFISKSYEAKIKVVHIDPPYNTDTSGFVYKNSYRHSSWLSMMSERLSAAQILISPNGHFVCHIDENEYERLYLLLNDIFSAFHDAGTIVWDKRNPMTGGKGVALQHEYVLWWTKTQIALNLPNDAAIEILGKANVLIKKFGISDQARKEFSQWINANNNLSGGEKAYRYIDCHGQVFQSVSLRAPEPRKDPKFYRPLIHPVTGKPCSVPPNGFSRTPETLKSMIDKGEIIFGEDELTQPRQKTYLTLDTVRQLGSVIEDALKGKGTTGPMGIDFPYCHPVSIYEKIFSISTEANDVILDFFGGSGTSGHSVLNLNRKDGGSRKYLMMEMGGHFDTATKPRMLKSIYSSEWKNGKPTITDGISHCFKYLRLESYEDALNNLVVKGDTARDLALESHADLRSAYLLNYWLDVETLGSPSLLNVQAFADPTNYVMNIKKPGSDAQALQKVDLIETFNWLMGLWVEHMAAPQSFTADFEREVDKDLPKDQNTRLVCTRLKMDAQGPYWFRLVEGYTLNVPGDDTTRQRTLVVWRKLTDDAEKDNAALQKFLMEKLGISPREQTYAVIYINGSHTLPNPLIDGEHTKVRLIEEAFHNAMWSQEVH